MRKKDKPYLPAKVSWMGHRNLLSVSFSLPCSIRVSCSFTTWSVLYKLKCSCSISYHQRLVTSNNKAKGWNAPENIYMGSSTENLLFVAHNTIKWLWKNDDMMIWMITWIVVFSCMFYSQILKYTVIIHIITYCFLLSLWMWQKCIFCGIASI